MGNAALIDGIGEMSAKKLELLSAFEAALQNFISSLDLDPSLSDPFHYAVFPGGKRIRPLFALLFGADLGAEVEKLILPVAALEILHCASLIHDDLPALDNDDIRRGRASTHKQFGEATAILLGDLMIAAAPLAITRSNFDAETKTKMIELMASSFSEVCLGQQIDLIGVKSRGEISRLHRLKTASLFRTCAGFAALAAELKPQSFSYAVKVGEGVGLLFQMIDDYIDIFGDSLQRGRPQSSDTKNHKFTIFSGGDAFEGMQLIDQLQNRIVADLNLLRESAGDISSFAGVEYIVSSILEVLSH